jgi:hypothetical protein
MYNIHIFHIYSHLEFFSVNKIFLLLSSHMLICTNKILYITQKYLSHYSISQMLSSSILIEKSWLATSRKNKINFPIGFKAKDLKLWKMMIPYDCNDLLSSLTLNDKDKLLMTRKIGEYWTEKLSKRHIHVLAKPPASTAISNREKKLLEENASLKEKMPH